jgi:hypothetical protein
MVVPDALPHRHNPRGGVSVKKKENKVPNIVETYHYGNTTVHIADNFIRTDPDEIEKILDELHAAGWRIVENLRERGIDV